MEGGNLISKAFAHPILDKVLYDLTLKLSSEVFTAIKNFNVEYEDLKKAVWVASILANSSNFEHKRKAQLFTSLLFLNNKNDVSILKVCYILFSRIGNLTATKFLHDLYENSQNNPVELKSKYLFGDLITEELLYAREQNIITSLENSYLTTDFQKTLWHALQHQSEISISAPTSAGKSFIIKQYLINEFSNFTKYKVLYIVPSRALINQVSEDFKAEIGQDVYIKTSFVAENEIYDKELYVLTPERCIKLLNSDIVIDFVFVDEIQGVEDTSGRGLTFEYVFSEISAKFPNSKLITAGPNINKPEKTFSEVFLRDSVPILTKLSPVFQLKIVVKNNEENKFDIEMHIEHGKTQTFTQTFDYNFANKTLGDTMVNFVNCVAPNDFNIIFVQDGDAAQKWAIKYSQLKNECDIDEEVNELIDFLKEDIHKKYFLIECLKKGVAYHHASLPDIVRKEIEDLYINEKISTIFCTSTLLEGVNLPANNLFTLQPKKDETPLTKFEFGNLIGRAGRLKSSLYGAVYYLERKSDKIKASEYFDAEYNKEIETFSSNALNDLEIEDLKLPLKSISRENKKDTDKARQLSIFLRHQYLKGEEYALKYLQSKSFTELEVKDAMNNLENVLSDISIPLKVLKNNPSIDPVLQNQLYEGIVKSDIREWVINKNSNYNEYQAEEEIVNIPIYERSFYWQFIHLLENLEMTFEIIDEARTKHHRWVSIKSLCLHARKWLGSNPIGKLINDNIRYQSGLEGDYRINPEDLFEVNAVINDTIKYNSSITTFLLPKYFKVLADILDEVLTDQQKDEYKLTLSLPTMLELGTQEPVVIQLISSGITRSVAIQIFEIYKKRTTKEYRENNDVLKWLSSQNDIVGLKPIYNRYLRRIKILKALD